MGDVEDVYAALPRHPAKANERACNGRLEVLLFGLVVCAPLRSGAKVSIDLIERVREATNGRLKLMQGRVYPVLRQLEREGLLRSWDGEALPERGGRPRRYYELTAEGRRTATAEAKTIAGLLKLDVVEM